MQILVQTVVDESACSCKSLLHCIQFINKGSLYSSQFFRHRCGSYSNLSFLDRSDSCIDVANCLIDVSCCKDLLESSLIVRISVIDSHIYIAVLIHSSVSDLDDRKLIFKSKVFAVEDDVINLLSNSKHFIVSQLLTGHNSGKNSGNSGNNFALLFGSQVTSSFKSVAKSNDNSEIVYAFAAVATNTGDNISHTGIAKSACNAFDNSYFIFGFNSVVSEQSSCNFAGNSCNHCGIRKISQFAILISLANNIDNLIEDFFQNLIGNNLVTSCVNSSQIIIEILNSSKSRIVCCVKNIIIL